MAPLLQKLFRRAPVESAAPAPTRGRRAWAAVREFLFLAILFTVYKYGRLLVRGHEQEAIDHARSLRHLEASLHLPSEAGLQAHLLTGDLARFFDVYYVTVHWPIMVAFLAWGYFRRPRQEYLWARNLLIIQTGLGLAIHLTYPLAPPRMFPQWGFVDTMNVFGPSAYGHAGSAVSNQYAAMPSLHLGWAVLIAVVVARTGPRWLAVLTGLHAFITLAVVILTANHWWLDCIVGELLLIVALHSLRRFGTEPQSRRTRTASEDDAVPAGDPAGLAG